MSEPNVPIRFEFSIEVPGTPDQVWDAIATANGISSWMMRTDLEEREGGAVAFHMGPDVSSEGTVTGWDPPRLFVYEEPKWAELSGHDSGTVTPLVSEFVVEATSGGTCVVRVVSSAFGSGADWEREFIDEVGKGWVLMFDHLRLYLTHFPGQKVTQLEAAADVPGTADAVVSALRRSLGVEEVGQSLDVRGASAVVERVAEDSLLLRVTDPVPGLLAFFAFGTGENMASRPGSAGYLFSDDAAAYVEREQPAWQAWLVGAAATA